MRFSPFFFLFFFVCDFLIHLILLLFPIVPIVSFLFGFLLTGCLTLLVYLGHFALCRFILPFSMLYNYFISSVLSLTTEFTICLYFVMRGKIRRKRERERERERDMERLVHKFKISFHWRNCYGVESGCLSNGRSSSLWILFLLYLRLEQFSLSLSLSLFLSLSCLYLYICIFM